MARACSVHFVMKRERLTVALNGATLIEAALLPGAPAKGPIGLQRHSDPTQDGHVCVEGL
ncbi:MAG: hypothetical protein E2O39_05410 [Planctomycetota bacterium]|nr:MAG: hypothetical protein E2O39_05410 [Planctomycetota bacterium]